MSHVTLRLVVCSFTLWTCLAALSWRFDGMFAWILAGTCDALTVLEAISTSAHDAFQDLPQNWVPHVSMRVCLSIVQTSSLVFPLEQDLHSGLGASFEVEFAQTLGRGPDPGCNGTVRTRPDVLPWTLVQ